MAEVFGIITGALSVVNLFNFCLEGFKYVQAGREFNQGYQRFQVKLEAEKRRLMQWGRNVGISDDYRFREFPPSDDSMQFIQSVLQQLKVLFDSVRDSTSGYARPAGSRDVVTVKTSRSFGWPRTQKNFTRTSRLKWALWDEEHLGKLVKQIKEFVDTLENLYPGEPSPRQMFTNDVHDIGYGLQSLTLENTPSSRSDVLLAISADNIGDAGWIRPAPPTAMSQERSTALQPAETWLSNYAQQMPSSQSWAALETNVNSNEHSSISLQHHGNWQRADSHPSHPDQYDPLTRIHSSVGRGSVSSAPMVPSSQDRSSSWQQNYGLRRHSDSSHVINPPARKSTSSNPSKSKNKSHPESKGYVLETGLDSSTITAVVIESRRIAYLTESQVHLFAFTWENGLEVICSQDLTQQSQQAKWKGVGLSGDYLATWGVCYETGQSLLSAFVLQSDASGSSVLANIELPYTEQLGLETFDIWKRVAVASTGLIACIKNSMILLLDIRNGCRVSVLESPHPDWEFIDIAFDEQSNVLYAWGMMNIYGALASWDMRNPYETSPPSVSYYECDTNESIHETRLFPYNVSLGCIISASANQLFFPASLEPSAQGKVQARRVSDELRKSKVRAACMVDDHSFLAIRRVSGLRKDFRIGEYDIRSGKAPGLRASGELYKLIREPQKGSQLGVFQEGGIRTVLICHLDGKVEVADVGPR